jgi:hypothetical protein
VSPCDAHLLRRKCDGQILVRDCVVVLDIGRPARDYACHDTGIPVVSREQLLQDSMVCPSHSMLQSLLRPASLVLVPFGALPTTHCARGPWQHRPGPRQCCQTERSAIVSVNAILVCTRYSGKQCNAFLSFRRLCHPHS